ncbi:MAG: acetate/propionate family kinase [Proteobacteria bacterium]|nr:acetate/propionate family kinase [Pseudomonadota bacterium]NOG61473.1 acetate/propionate family kinase [Pseudomonadota bacterium]
MSCQVLVLNSGSSSIKFSLFDEQQSKLVSQYNGQITGLGLNAHFTVCGFDNNESISLSKTTDHLSALKYLFDWLKQKLNSNKELFVGHRVVHGGNDFHLPTVVTPEILTKLKKLEPLAPLHQTYNLAAIESLMHIDQAIPQVACFDTAFHANHGKPNNQFALPDQYYEQGVRRYGFHGLSYEYIATELKQTEPELASGKIIVAHLGNGSSLCALNQCKSIDSSMGFSALDGLMMGTRCGSIDAGVILYLLEEKKLNAQQVNDLLYKQSGLLGVSKVSNDMSALLQSEESTAQEAIDLYIHRIIREAGCLLALLKGIDGLVFTAGIGENAAEIRKRICDELVWLGVEIDENANRENCSEISTNDSTVRVLVIPTNEELMIAQHTYEILNNEVSMPRKLAIGN